MFYVQYITYNFNLVKEFPTGQASNKKKNELLAFAILAITYQRLFLLLSL